MKKIVICIILAISFTSFPSRAQYTREVANAETWMQYVPLALDLSIGFTQKKSEYQFPERLIKIATGYATEVILTQGLKHIVNEQRPDGSANNSFPSGHTAIAFLGAEFVRQDYGWGYGIGAYAIATTVGVMRVVHQRHWWWDTVAGAGIGILSANVGKWTLEPIERLFHYYPKMETQWTLSPTVDPMSGAICARMNVTF